MNNQVTKYVSRRPDPKAFATDAFSLTWSHDLYFIFPPFSLLARILQKVGGQNRGSTISTNLANSVLVAKSATPNMRSVLSTSQSTGHTIPPPRSRQETQVNKNEPSSFSYIRESLRGKGIPQQATDIILQSWRNSTKIQYNEYINKWIKFCGQDIDPLQPNISEI